MADYVTKILDLVPETSTGSIAWRVLWRDGVFAKLDDFAAARVTFFEESTDTIINGRDHQDILADPDFEFVDMVENGESFCRIKWTFAEADTTCITSRDLETHQAVFRFVHGSGEVCPFAIRVPIQNLGHTPP